MAYKPININPLDLKPRVAIGVSLPFNGNAVFNSTYNTKDQIRSNLLNLFLTEPNERLFQPEFGIDLGLFENMDEELIDNMKIKIEDAINTYFPQININELKVLSSPDFSLINVIIKYSVPNLGISDNLNINFAQ